jgi:Na+-transporting NADH:ubiquinone oxidoreductase subunit A
MALHETHQGLSLPISGEPRQEVSPASPVSRVALLGDDYPEMRPTMLVEPGDRVKLGQPVFEDKKTPGVLFTAPGSGRVMSIHRGERRAFQSLVIELDGSDDAVEFSVPDPGALDREGLRRLLLQSGLWTSLRARPFGRVANPAHTPRSIFVTAMDSHPHAPLADAVITLHQSSFVAGVRALALLTDGPVYVCTSDDSPAQIPEGSSFRHERFKGPHPAGTAGVHIHTLDPVNREKLVWHIGYQDAIAIGKLLETGRLAVERTISLAGPGAREPRLLRTRLGAAIDEIVKGELKEGEQRVVSGSVLFGRTAAGEVHGYLGRYHRQISVLPEGREREFLGWLRPGANRFSVTRAFLSSLAPSKKFAFSTATHGSPRAIIPIGTYERVLPMDILATFLLRAIVMRDLERAEELGCLEFDEEDVSLMTFVCPGKIDYGPHLRQVLTTLEKEG